MLSKTSEREHMLHERLKAAYDRDVVTFYTNFDKLHAPASPVFDPWLAVGPFVGLLLLAVTILFMGGLVAGTVAIIIAATSYVMGVRPWLERQFRDRAIAMALQDVKSFQTLWEYGGIGIAMTDRPETITPAPEGHWKHFINKHLPNIETEVLDREMQNFVPGDFPDRRFDLTKVVVPDPDRTPRMTRRMAEERAAAEQAAADQAAAEEAARELGEGMAHSGPHPSGMAHGLPEGLPPDYYDQSYDPPATPEDWQQPPPNQQEK